MSMNAYFDYFVFGLRVRSAIRLHALPQSGIDRPDVEIRLGKIPKHPGVEPSGLYLDAQGAVLNIPAVGRFLIPNGGEIIVDADDTASERNVELFLLGSAFGAILHRRQLLPLHANAIEIDGRAVAFTGHSGAGKSTLASWFADRGFRILSDDVCVVTIDSDGVPYASAGIPRLRLWKDALEMKGVSQAGLYRSYDGHEKFDLPIQSSFTQAPVKLNEIYVLGRTDQSGDRPQISDILGATAVEALSVNTYRGAYISLLGNSFVHIKHCIAVANAVSVRRFDRPWNRDSFDADAQFLLDRLRA